MRVELAVAVFGVAAFAAALTGCPGQTPVCARYVECQAAIDPAVDTTPWQQEGSCWRLPESARSCDAQCDVALTALRQTPSPPPSCLDDSTD